MAVINSPWVGVGRGKLGQAVYFRNKGNTVARSYNPEPLNRRTVSQQFQRSQFSTAVKFFSRGVQNLFQFAFENKRPNESDYNAFMRLNAKRGMYFGPAQNASETYPAWGDWIMTRGSLNAPQQLIVDETKLVMRVPVTTPPPAQFDTLGDLSAFLIAQGYQQGDILTFVVIDTNGRAGSEGEPFVGNLYGSRWEIFQIILDSSSSQALSDLSIFVTPASNQVDIAMDAYINTGNAGGGAVIFSRIDSGKLLVSNSQLMLNEQGRLALNYGRSDTWEALVMEAWGTEQLSILQGSVARAVQRRDAVTVSLSFALPVVDEELQDEVISISGIWTAAEIERHLQLVTDSPSGVVISASGSTLYFQLGDTSWLMGNVRSLGADTVVLIGWDSSDLPGVTISDVNWV